MDEKIGLLLNHRAEAKDVEYFDPSDRDGWEQLLTERDLYSAEEEGVDLEDEEAVKVFKNNSPAVTGAIFPAGSKLRKEHNCVSVGGLVLDVDDKAVYTLPELQELLHDVMFIAWSSFSSTPEDPRWRVVIPLAQPIPPSLYRSFWALINRNAFEGKLSNLDDPVRLGYLNRVRTEAQKETYQWYFNEAPQLDWREYEGSLTHETPTMQLTAELPTERRAYWSSRSTALDEAVEYYTHKAEIDKPQEGGRHIFLYQTACHLWWDWAAEDNNFVLDVLTKVNEKFDSPKDDDDLLAEVAAGYKQVIVDKRAQTEDFGVRREPPVAVTKETMEALIPRWKALGMKYPGDVGQTWILHQSFLKKALKGELLCTPENANKLAGFFKALGSEFPRNPAESIYHLVSHAVKTTIIRHDSLEYTLAEATVLDRIRYGQKLGLLAKERKEEARSEKLAEKIAQAFGNGRDYPYSKEELRAFSDNGLQKTHWIIQHKKDYYIFFDGNYIGPFNKDSADAMSSRMLAPAPELQIHRFDPTGKLVEKPLLQLIKDFGSIALKMEYNYHLPASRFSNGIFQMAAATRSLLLPERFQDVEDYIDALAGPKAEQFRDYLAAFPNLRYPLPCLYLFGPAGTGKSTLYKALTALFKSKHVLKLENLVVSQFNAQVCESPIIVCEERIPESVKKNGSLTALFRDLVASNEHRMERKWSDATTLHGALRLIIAANNKQVLTDDKEFLSKLDVDATMTRFFLLETTNASKAFIEKIGPERFNEIIDHDFARHVLWLAKNRKIDFTKRFVVQDNDLSLEAALVTGKETTSLVCEFFSSWFSRPPNSSQELFWRFVDDDLWVNVNLLVGSWEECVIGGSHFRLTKKQIAEALSMICTGDRKGFYSKAKGGQAKTTWLRKVNLEYVLQWVQNSDVMSEEEFVQLVLDRQDLFLRNKAKDAAREEAARKQEIV